MPQTFHYHVHTLAGPIAQAGEASRRFLTEFDIAASLFSRLFETCADAVKRYGGEMRLRTRVEQTTIEDGQVRGVVTREGAFQAPIEQYESQS